MEIKNKEEILNKISHFLDVAECIIKACNEALFALDDLEQKELKVREITYKQAVAERYPDKISNDRRGGIIGCPFNYNLYPTRCRPQDIYSEIPREEVCEACWSLTLPVGVIEKIIRPFSYPDEDIFN